MSKNKNTYRDIIYFNGDKVSSILAQLNRGLIDSMITTNLTADSATEKSEESKALELIGFSVDSNGSFSKINSLGLQEVKTLHDFALTKVLDTLPFKNVSNLDRTTLNSNSDRTFVLVSGIFSIYDYANFSELLGKINIIDKLFDNPINKGNESIDSFSKFVREAYQGLTTVDIENKKGINFTGVIDTNHLRETSRNIIYKYGTKPKGEWEMLCQITNIPENNKLSMQELFNNFGMSLKTTEIGKEKSMSSFINQMVKETSKIYDLFASVSYPNISVEPIAIYKTVYL